MYIQKPNLVSHNSLINQKRSLTLHITKLKYSSKIYVTLIIILAKSKYNDKNNSKHTYHLYSSFHSMCSKWVEGLDDRLSTPLHPYKQRSPCTPAIICTCYALALFSLHQKWVLVLSYFVHVPFLKIIFQQCLVPFSLISSV